MKWTFTFLAVIGTILPLSQFLPWLAEYGLDIPFLFDQLFINAISRFFALDLIVCAMVTALLIVGEGKRSGVPRLWLPLAGTFLIGVSLGLPMFLAMRESVRDRSSVERLG